MRSLAIFLFGISSPARLESSESHRAMTERGKQQPPFDERTALGELERFRADIERYRKQRESVSDDFEAFVRSFPSPVDVFPSEQPASQASATSAAHPASSAPRVSQAPASTSPAVSSGPLGAAPSGTDATRPAPVPSPIQSAGPATKPPVEAARPAAAPPPGAPHVETRKRTRTPLVATLLLLLLVAAVGVWMFRGGQLQPQTSSPPSPGQTTQPAAPGDTAPAPTPPVVAPAPVESEITTVRRAWVRLIADGERVLERELPADTRVPFKAEKTIVIRTGDAGAVVLTIRGKDHGPLGRDGEVVTRSFTVPADQPR